MSEEQDRPDTAAEGELVRALRSAVRADRGASPLPGPEPGAAPRIGGYRLRRWIGEGAMGVVYEAEQEHPPRTVALKLVRPGLATPRVLRRFELEAEALGRLEHPGVARIYGAGTWETEGGPQPFFAMEIVHGRSLPEHADAEGLGTRARIALFSAVCDAVQHAHQKGVIHRDLKPANLVVDAQGRPRVLDFGVARLVDAPDEETLLRTRAGELVGTLAYASPEQLAGDPDAVDARADVYALGVVLYELLCGRRPLELGGTSVPEAVRRVTEDEPPPMGRVRGRFARDLEAIVGKALAKEPARRYASAAALADDLRRYLADEPVSARPSSGWYQLHKLVRRQRALFAGIAAVVLALAAGVAATGIQARRARRAEALALESAGRERQAADEARRQAAAADAARVQAEAAARRASSAADFLQSVLEQASPDQQTGAPTLVGVLEEAARRVDELADDPVVEAEIRVALGRAMLGLGEHERARRHLERGVRLREAALGPEHLETARARQELVSLALASGDPAAAERLAAPLFAVLEAGGDDPGVQRDLGTLWGSVAAARFQSGRLDGAEEALLRALEHYQRWAGPRCADAGRTLRNLALLQRDQGRAVEAEALLREALGILEQALGEQSLAVASTLHELARLRSRHGEPGEALALAERALAIRRGRLDERHAEVAASLALVAELRRPGGAADER